ncbi:cation-transporting P-type ATPase [Thiohalorhabdus methylotrophus]|uniref:Cation-transporting P-type ATPase n=1 Tax=Thiohalorhabdus methylotrophus TaxID=3242694 RepID=A0ABV4TVC5_9GAMM
MTARPTERPPASPAGIRADSWHARSPEDTLARLGTTREGLPRGEALERLDRYGPNRLTPPRRRGPVRRFLVQFHNVLIYVLLLSAVTTAALAHWVDTGVILGVVMANAVIGFLQEGKAERALDAIRDLLSPRAVAVRNGQRTTLPAEQLVPGDVVLLQSGDRVPADLRLLKVHNLTIDEAALTGESMPVRKGTEAVAERAALADRPDMAYSGTMVRYGQGRGVVVATGDSTELGRISTLLAEVNPLTTPLLREMGRFGRVLSLAIGGLAAALFSFGVLVRGYSAVEMFMAAVGLAVAAIPEGLPAIITITLAVGVQTMAARRAIVRRLPAVETLGSVTVICSDKTGTLTRNEMTVASVAESGRTFGVTGDGYDPHGGVTLDGTEVDAASHPGLTEIIRAGLLCNDAGLYRDDGGRWAVDGDPTEGALVTLARKAGLDPVLESEERPRQDLIPFESEHRFMATLHHDHFGHAFVYLKGAPERVLAMCSHQRHGGEDVPLDSAYWHAHAEGLAAQGQRVLALAFGAMTPDHGELRFADVEEGLTLLGLVGMMDPPRSEAIEAVHECRQAGIRVKMITGDHAVTARAVGERLGIGDGVRTRTGDELDALDDAGLRGDVRAVDVFARVSPEHKLRLVEALQSDGEVVAMTGDGVNDAPALKRADVGVAMGVKGTEVAKEAAEMVLADDNFASITAAVREGRTVYDNIKKSILFILPTNGGEALTILAAVLLGRELPITPVQILWVNMITAVTLGLALAFEASEPGVMRRPPREPGASLLSAFMIARIVLVSLAAVAVTFGLFLWERVHGTEVEEARTLAVNTLVLVEAFYLFSTRRIRDPIRGPRDLLGNGYVLAAAGTVAGGQLLFTYAPFMQYLFGTRPLSWESWGQSVAAAALVFLLVEISKHLRGRDNAGQNGSSVSGVT